MDNIIKSFDFNTKKLFNEFVGQNSTINCLAFTLNGQYFANGSSDNTVKVWKSSGGFFQKTFYGHSFSVRSVSFSSDGTKIVSGGDDKSVRIWDIETKNNIKTFDCQSSVIFVGFSFIEDYVFGVFGDEITFWEVETGDLIKKISHGEKILGANISDQKDLIVTVSQNKFKIWGKTKTQMNPKIVCSEEGNLLVTNIIEVILNVWEKNTGKFIKSFPKYGIQEEIKKTPELKVALLEISKINYYLQTSILNKIRELEAKNAIFFDVSSLSLASFNILTQKDAFIIEPKKENTSEEKKLKNETSKNECLIY